MSFTLLGPSFGETMLELMKPWEPTRKTKIMKPLTLIALAAAITTLARADYAQEVLKAEAFRHYVEEFNRNDHELYQGTFPNAAAWDFLKDNIPRLDCPDEDIQRTYYFRWWTYRKHIKQTPAGFIVDEFLPNVGWAGKYNSISCAAGHHLYEGRWLRDPIYLDDYSVFWFRGGGEPRRYSFWAADSIWARCCVTGDKSIALSLLPDLIANYAAWETSRRDANGLYWQVDDRDGMEVSIGGSGYRATINSYQYGDALAIAHMAELAGQADVAREYREKAAAIKQRVQDTLWDPDAHFFKVLPRGENQSLAKVRELHGFTPWYFHLPDPPFASAWKQIMDPLGFFAPFGPTTAEQRCPDFALAYAGHECQWNGPSWPYSTAVTLTALANLLNGPPQNAIRAQDYFELLKIYAKSHRLKLEDGRVVPWIDENLNPINGDWISRTRLKTWKNGTWDAGKGGEERGKDYNHSTFCDLVISGLIGLRPRADSTVEVNPLVPPSWDYFCLDHVLYHDRNLTICFDRTGSRYGKGKGLRVFADGKAIATADLLTRVTGPLPPPASAETSGGREELEGHPVMGGTYGARSDLSVLREGEKSEPPKPTRHTLRTLEGWTVRVDDRLLAPPNDALGTRALRFLEYKLSDIKAVVAAEPLAKLQAVGIVIDLSHGKLRSMQYHPSADWLRENGYATNLVKCVHIPEAADLPTPRNITEQPWVVLHELAHAYHDQVLGFKEPRILKAYEDFKRSGRGDRALLYDGSRVRHYGLTDQKEFFAEMTESYFGLDDFFPFNRAELMTAEPVIYDLMQTIWGPVAGAMIRSPKGPGRAMLDRPNRAAHE